MSTVSRIDDLRLLRIKPALLQIDRAGRNPGLCPWASKRRPGVEPCRGRLLFRFRASVRKRTEYALARVHQLNAALLARRLALAGPGHTRPIPRRLGRHAGDAHFVQLVERLNLVSPEFAEWWPRHDALPMDRGPQRLRSSEGRTNDSREH
jgi:hypothetical protein